ncbi:MAG TPA: LysR family transcriptional regulator [Xanthobacteraceae bacterium]|jgi:DNA-binding transcriptional LysR family regulator|nr:LysR family transcriptional regulator [Xanthobacteraceae bacterium]
MGIRTIPTGYGGLDLHHLQVLDVLLREHSLTRAAKVLDVSQPALSKTLAQLRRYFGDPLFVRVALRMEPTAKAQQLEAPVRAVLAQMQALRSQHAPFDPKTSARTFNFCVVDAGVIKLLPPLVNLLLGVAPQIRLRAVQLDAEHLEPWLESGKIDFAMGSFPSLVKGIRRQRLWTERYVSVVRSGHPRIRGRPSLRTFAAEKHVLVSTQGTGHAHRAAERALEAVIPSENIVCRVPMFIGAAVLAKHTDAVATLPWSIAAVLADDLNLDVITPPVAFPKIEIYQYWHDRFHREPGNQWIRSVFVSLFGKPPNGKRA